MKEFATVLFLVAATTTVSVAVVVFVIQRLYHSERIGRWMRRYGNNLRVVLGVTWLVLAGLHLSQESERFTLSTFLELGLGVSFLGQAWVEWSARKRAAP